MTNSVKIEIDPRLIIPTCGVRSVDEAKIRALSDALKSGLTVEPIMIFEVDGYLLLVDGHHRWAAHILAEKTEGISAKVLNSSELSNVSPLDADTIMQEVSWSSVFDWEDALSVRLISAVPRSEDQELPLLILSGPSGVGKSRILSELRKNGIRLANLATTTTRSKRSSEVDGIDYDFVSPVDFSSLIQSGTFCEWQYVHGNFYGSRIDRMFDQPDGGFRIKDLDAYGALQIKSLYPSSTEIVFVDVDEFYKIRERLIARGTDDTEQSLKRISRARVERELRLLFDEIVVNEEVEVAAQEVLRVAKRSMAAERAIPFFELKEFHGSFVKLEIVDASNQVVVWNNLKEKVVPLLLIPPYLSAQMGFRFLEQIILDQFSTELMANGSGNGVLRALTHALDTASISGPELASSSCGSFFYTKRLRCDDFGEFANSASHFFSTSEELWRGQPY